MKYLTPLIIFLVPTIIISIILFIFEPPSIYTLIGFIVLLISACGTYYLGIRTVINDKEES